MSVSQLSESNQNYLKAVWNLSEWSDEPVTTTLLAAKTGVALSTASDAIRKLSSLGLVDHARYGAVSLTPKGLKLAVTMVRRHRLLELFLVESLGYKWDQVHAEAEVLEHSVSDFMIEQIDQRLGYPKRDPHGDPIPAADGTVDKLDAIQLSQAEIGKRVRVERIADTDSELLQFLALHGISFGTILEIRPATAFSDLMKFIVEDTGKELMLGNTASNSVWVARV